MNKWTLFMTKWQKKTTKNPFFNEFVNGCFQWILNPESLNNTLKKYSYFLLFLFNKLLVYCTIISLTSVSYVMSKIHCIAVNISGRINLFCTTPEYFTVAIATLSSAVETLTTTLHTSHVCSWRNQPDNSMLVRNPQNSALAHILWNIEEKMKPHQTHVHKFSV